jgi:uncharacterized protein (DUF983 family)
MNVSDTKPLEKICSKCGVKKIHDMFIKNRNICKACRNAKCRDNYKLIQDISEEKYLVCNTCSQTKLQSLFIKSRLICKDCNNLKRRDKYKNNEDYRIKAIQQASNFKQNKIIERNKKIEEEIGIDNKKCKYCLKIKNKERFRHNRLKCKDCEREEPISKIIRNVRGRILSAIKNKTNHTIDYLGCNCNDYLKWLLTQNQLYNYENYGKKWHIDHVIPISHFNIIDEKEQMIAFNWRNTMPLSVEENLSKNNKIIKEQIKQHYDNLQKYHNENNIEMPQIFINLFAKHLDDGNPLKLSLPFTLGNISEELS